MTGSGCCKSLGCTLPLSRFRLSFAQQPSVRYENKKTFCNKRVFRYSINPSASENCTKQLRLCCPLYPKGKPQSVKHQRRTETSKGRAIDLMNEPSVRPADRSR